MRRHGAVPFRQTFTCFAPYQPNPSIEPKRTPQRLLEPRFEENQGGLQLFDMFLRRVVVLGG